MNTATVSKVIRRVHLYLGLFLVPWMLIYALSTLGMNHWPRIKRWYGGVPVKFEKEKELDYAGAFSGNASDKQIAGQILRDMELDGPFVVRGSVKQGRLTILRQAALVPRRLTFWPERQRLLIERQVFRTPNFLNRMHTRHGYGQPYLAADLWAGSVDLVVMALLFWGLSGLWMWWELKPTRALGAVFLLAGLGVFVVFLCVL